MILADAGIVPGRPGCSGDCQALIDLATQHNQGKVTITS